MPYIRAELRPALDHRMDDLIERLRAMPLEEQDGALNYVITRLLMSLYPARYMHYNRAIGVLECAKQEFYRVAIGPYEDEKRRASGEVIPMPQVATTVVTHR